MSESPVPITPGSGGASIASDLVAGNNYQQIKLVDGTLGSSNAFVINADGTANIRILGSVVTAGGTFTGSVSGTVGASAIGTFPVIQSTSPWIITGSIQGTFNSPANQSVSGTVGASIIGTVPVNIVAGGSTGSVAANIQGSVAVVIIGGSIAASFTPPANQSVSGTVGASIIGAPPVTQGGTWIASVFGNVSVIGTVPVTQATTPWVITGSVQGSFSPSGNQSVSGTVGASIIGQLPAGNAVLGAVAASISGTVNVSGSVFAVVQALQGASVSGAVNISGSVLTVSNAPTSSWVSAATSVFTGVIQPVIPAQGTSIFTYVTGVQVANNSANAVYVSFLNGIAGSIIGYTIAPANGGSNITMPNALKTLANGAFSASISGVASVFVTAEGFTQNT